MLYSVKNVDLELVSSNDFFSRLRNNKKFAKELHGNKTKCFVDFLLFKQKKAFAELGIKGVVVFPIDTKKVPYELKGQF